MPKPFKRIRPKKYYKILKTESDGVDIDYSMTFRITDSCNFKCGYCFWNDGINYPYEAVTQTVANLYDFFVKEGFKSVLFYFHGGEPSLHPQVIEILKYMRAKEKEYGIKTYLEFQTNLSLKKQVYIDINDYVDFFDVTYHHLEVTKHNNYPTFKDNLETVSGYGNLRNLDIMLENVEENDIDHFYSNIKEILEYPCQYSEMIYGFCHYKYNAETKQRYLDFYKKHNKYEQQYEIDGKIYNTNDLFKEGLDCRGWICDVGQRNITINGDGNVFMCGIHMTNFTHRCSDDPPYTNIVTDPSWSGKMSILRKIPFKCRWDFCGGDFYIPRYKKDESEI